jgi:lysine-specific metallo-endopeptidase family protein
MMHAPLQTEAAAPVRVPALGRACACGATAGVSGRCADCEARMRLGAQPGFGGPGEFWTSAGETGEGVLQRTPAEPAPAPADVRPPDQLHVYTKVTTEAEPTPGRTEASGTTVGPFYPGDTVRVEVFKDRIEQGTKAGKIPVPEPITATFSSPDIEVAETLPSMLIFRVVGDPGPATVEATLASAAFTEPLVLRMALASRPAAPQALDPEGQRRAAAVEALEAAGGQDREARRELRKARGELAEYKETAAISVDRQRLIQAALERGAARAANTVARLGAPDVYVENALEQYFTPANADRVRRTLQRLTDVLNVARNGMLTAVHGQFEHGEDCDEETGAYVSERARGKTVTVCERWFTGDMPAISADPGEAQAIALLHEFVHLAGVTAAGDELYAHSSEFVALTAEQALTMADAYAAFAKTLGAGS